MKNPFKYAYRDYPGGGPYRNESTNDFCKRMWADVPKDKKAICVNYLREKLKDSPAWDEVTKLIEDNPGDWLKGDMHFDWGMSIRNLLRDVMPDSELVTGNWDDYYSAVVEEALGF